MPLASTNVLNFLNSGVNNPLPMPPWEPTPNAAPTASAKSQFWTGFKAFLPTAPWSELNIDDETLNTQVSLVKLTLEGLVIDF